MESFLRQFITVNQAVGILFWQKEQNAHLFLKEIQLHCAIFVGLKNRK